MFAILIYIILGIASLAVFLTMINKPRMFKKCGCMVLTGAGYVPCYEHWKA